MFVLSQLLVNEYVDHRSSIIDHEESWIVKDTFQNSLTLSYVNAQQTKTDSIRSSLARGQSRNYIHVHVLHMYFRYEMSSSSEFSIILTRCYETETNQSTKSTKQIVLRTSFHGTIACQFVWHVASSNYGLIKKKKKVIA